MNTQNTKEFQKLFRKKSQQAYSDSTDDEVVPQNHCQTNCETKINKCKYKSELCKNFSQMGWCRYGMKCQYAHGYNDVSLNVIQPKKMAYRTRKCNSFWNEGKCPYGKRCQFSHYQLNQSSKLDKAYLSVHLHLIQDCHSQGQSRLLNMLKN